MGIKKLPKPLIVVGKILAGILGAVLAGWLVSRIPWGGFILLYLFILLIVGFCVGVWSKGAPPFFVKASRWLLGRPVLSGGGALFLIIAIIAAISFWKHDRDAASMKRLAEETAQREAAATAKAERAAKEASLLAARQEQLRKGVSSKTPRFQAAVKSSEEALQQKDLQTAQQSFESIRREMLEYEIMKPIPAEIQALIPVFKNLSDRLQRISDARKALGEFNAGVSEAQGMESGDNTASNWQSILEIYQTALGQIQELERADKESRGFLPDTPNLTGMRRNVEAKIKQAELKLGKISKEEAMAQTASDCAQKLTEKHLSSECAASVCAKCAKQAGNENRLASCILKSVAKLRECPNVYSPSEIYSDYDRNEVAADQKYKNKWIIINGVCDSINKDIFNNPFILLRAGGYGMYFVSVSPDDSYESFMGELTKGDRIQAVCNGIGKTLITPSFADCVFF